MGVWNGTAWSWQIIGGSAHIYDVHGAGGTVYAVEKGGLRFRRSGTWGYVAAPAGHTNDNLFGVWAVDERNVYVVGDDFGVKPNKHGVILHFSWTSDPLTDGLWEASSIDLPDGNGSLSGVWADSTGVVHVAGTILLEGSGTSWSVKDSLFTGTTRFHDLAGSNRDAIAVGDEGAVWRLAR